MIHDRSRISRWQNDRLCRVGCVLRADISRTQSWRGRSRPHVTRHRTSVVEPCGLPPGSGLRSRTRGGATHSRSACQTGRPLVSGLERQEKEISMLPCLTEPKTYGFKRIDLKPRYKAVQYPAGRVPSWRYRGKMARVAWVAADGRLAVFRDSHVTLAFARHDRDRPRSRRAPRAARADSRPSDFDCAASPDSTQRDRLRCRTKPWVQNSSLPAGGGGRE